MRKMLCVAVTSMGILFAGCNSPVFTPIASPNPWQDDYSFLSSMDNYRSWFGVKPRFACAAAADNDRVEVAAVFSSVQTHTDILREDLVVLWCGCPVFSVDGSGRAPLGRTVFLAPTVIAAGR